MEMDFEAVRRPLAEAGTLPPECYTSDAFHRREVARIFMRRWNLIGRADYWPEPGDYAALTLAGAEYLVIRDGDGRLRAFANSCRHRGARLLDGEGRCERIVCPYHGWTYGIDGRLDFANGMDRARNFDAQEYGLVEIPLGCWQGFAFVNFDPGCAPLADHLGDLGRHLESYGLGDMVTVRRAEYSVRTNWKSYVENSMESFHHATVHRNSVNDPSIGKTVVRGAPGEYVLVQSDSGGRTRALLKGTDGFPPIPTLAGPAALGSQYLLVYPATMIGCDVDSMWFKQMLPDGPDRVRNVVAICFPRETAARADFDTVVQHYYRRFETAIAEDNEIAERQFAGLASPLARPGRFSHREPLVHAIDNWILDQLDL